MPTAKTYNIRTITTYTH
uniref:Uncharacterized protein n=1 Tax=Arundo donax TaxID=35708 RepID=A0A0A9B662_ARUDO